MTPLTLFLAKLIGAYTLVMTAWMLLRKDVALQFVERMTNQPMAMAVVGMIRVTVGLAIVLGHDLWDSGAALLVSIVGWAALLSGIFTLFMPPATVRAAFSRLQYGERYYLFALFSFALGGALLIAGFSG